MFGLKTYKHELEKAVAIIPNTQEYCLKHLSPLNALMQGDQTLTFSKIPNNVQKIINTVPQEFNDLIKDDLNPLIDYVKKYQDVLKNFDYVYVVYRKKLNQNQKKDFDAFVSAFQSRIAESFPEIKRVADLLNQETVKIKNVIEKMGAVVQNNKKYNEKQVGQLLTSWNSLKQSCKSLKPTENSQPIASMQFLLICVSTFGALPPFDAVF